MAEQPREAENRPRRWRFLSAVSVILAVMVIGDIVGRLLVKMSWRLEAGEGVVLKDWLLFAFFLSSAAWLWLIRKSVVRFFRSMHTGVALVVLTTVCVGAGVLVPQMDGFEDPRQRITAENEEEQYNAFRWAEGYFFYHLLHLYGIGMPQADIPPPALANLDRFGRRYGLEERGNRLKRMEAAFTGQAKTGEIREFIYAHDGKFRAFFDVCTFLQLNRAYKSAWFATLLGLLGCAVFLNTFTGKPRSWVSLRRIGFFVTHCGMLTLLIGGVVSKLTTARGIMHLDLRDGPRDEFALNYDRHQRARLPFHVGLERFARKEWMQIEVDFPDDGFTSRPPSYTLWPGRVIDLDYVEGEGGELRPRRRLRVRDLHDRAEVETNLTEGEEGVEAPEGLGVGALAEFALTPAGGHGGDDLDHPDHPGHEDHAPATQIVRRVPALPPYATLSDPDWQFRIRTSYGIEDPDELFARFPADDGSIGTLFIREKTGNEASETPYPIRIGETLELPAGYRVEVREAVPDYRLDRGSGAEIRDGRALAEQVPSNPAVICWITPPGGGEPERRVVRQDVDAVSQGLQSDYDYSELVLYLLWDEWLAPGPERRFLHWGPEVDPVLVSEDGTVTPVETGVPLPLGSSTELSLARYFRRAVFSQNVRFEERGSPEDGTVDLDFYSRDKRGLSLEVTTDPDTEDEIVEQVELVTDAGLSSSWRSAEGDMALTFFENTAMMPFEWRSVLSIHEEGPDGELVRVDTGTERDSEIRVNDYFYWDGYRFFQTNADPDFPTYSGIGVVYDPGIPGVLAGMYVIIAGTILAFIVRPIVRAREKKEQAA